MVDVVVIGAGLRGRYSYGAHASAAGVCIVAVVDPNEVRRQQLAADHGIAPEQQHPSVADWLAAPRVADAVIVATPDDQHLEPTLAALSAGYHVLLEKPMAQSVEECQRLVDAAEAADRQLHVCHVLRYTPFFRAIRDIVSSGRLGRIITVEHRENVDARHMAHSYVRGAYRRADTSNPMLLAKSCHDLDVLHWILDDPVVRVSSVGSLLHFRPDTPAALGVEVPDRCTDGCPIEATCTFSAPRLYATAERIDPHAGAGTAWFLRAFPLTDPPTMDRASRLEALTTSPFGRCVYRCDNDVVDHQLVSMELASGTSVAFAMHGHSHDETRTMRYDGTLATLRATFGPDPAITIHHHGTGEVDHVDLDAEAGSTLDHGGGDQGVLRAFAASLEAAAAPGAGVADGLITDARTSLESHVLGWAAEEARTTRTVVDLADFKARNGLA